MKTFGNEHYRESTITVGEMKAILAKHPDDMPVLATWEGIYTSFRGLNYFNPRNGETRDYVEVETPTNYFPFEDLKEPCLVFDVDQY